MTDDELSNLDFPIDPEMQKKLSELEDGHTHVEIAMAMDSGTARRIVKQWDDCELRVPAQSKLMMSFIVSQFELLREALNSPVEMRGEDFGDEEEE